MVCWRILGRAQRVSLVRWCMLQDRVIVFGSCMICWVGIFLLRSLTQIYLLALYLKKFGLLSCLCLGEVEAGIFNSTKLFMARSFFGGGGGVLFLSFFILIFQGVKVMVLWLGSWLRMVLLMCALTIIFYLVHLLILSLKRAFDV